MGIISLTRDWEWSKGKTTPTHNTQNNDVIVVVDPRVVWTIDPLEGDFDISVVGGLKERTLQRVSHEIPNSSKRKSSRPL